jgi:integrase
MASIRRRNGSWQARVTRRHQPSFAKSFATKADALLWARQIETQLDASSPNTHSSKLASLKLAEVLDQYLQKITSYKRGKASETYRIKALQRHWLGQKRLKEISKADAYTYRDECLQRVKVSTLRRQLNLLSHVWNISKDDWGAAIGNNPFTKLPLPRMPSGRIRRLNPDEERKLFGALAQCKNKAVAGVVRFALETGLRRSELLRLRWSNIDLEKAFIYVQDTKNGHPRWIPLTSAANYILEQRGQDGDLVFPISDNALQLAWQRSIRRASIADLHFHDLRHEALSRWADYLGGDVFKLCQISGHKTLSMVMRYVHPLQTHFKPREPIDTSQGRCAPSDDRIGIPSRSKSSSKKTFTQ